MRPRGEARASAVLCLAGAGEDRACLHQPVRHSFDRQFAFVFDEDEDVADSFGCRRGCQNHIPCQITMLRVHLVQWRNRDRVEGNLKLSEFP